MLPCFGAFFYVAARCFSRCLIFWCFWIKPKARKKESKRIFFFDRSFGKQSCPSDCASPARSGFTTFCHQKVVPKVSARRKAAGNSQRLAKTGACRGFASKPAPFFNARRCSFLFPHFSQCGDCCALRATMILISFYSVLAGLRPAGSHCKNNLFSFRAHPAPPIGCLLQGADLPPFVTKRWRQKCPQGTSVGIGRRCSLSGHKRLRCCDAKDCTASTVAARQSPQAASALACCPSFSRPLRALEPPSDLIPPPVQCGDSCALCAMIIIRLRPHMAGLRPAGSHCEKSGKIPTLHCIPPGMTNPVILRRKSKPIPTQASPPASPSKQRRKRPCPIGFRHICPKTEK